MALFRPHTRGHIMAEINVTPLTDVFLVLLIIFMITTSAMVKPAADVDLPKADSTEEETKGVMVTRMSRGFARREERLAPAPGTRTWRSIARPGGAAGGRRERSA